MQPAKFWEKIDTKTSKKIPNFLKYILRIFLKTFCKQRFNKKHYSEKKSISKNFNKSEMRATTESNDFIIVTVSMMISGL